MELRNRLWNALDIFYWSTVSFLIKQDIYGKEQRHPILKLLTMLWDRYYKMPLDTLNMYWNTTYSFIRTKFFGDSWSEVYDFIEFIANNDQNVENAKTFVQGCNCILEEEGSGYRFVGGYITSIISEEEINSIEDAIKDASTFNGASTHLKASLRLFSDKKKPDYRNSIKESISAVESVCCNIVGEKSATLGKALNVIEKEKNIVLHSALKSAFEKLYGYTSDAEGIRHGLLEESNLQSEDAKFMLIACSAFVNYLIVKSCKKS